MPDDRVAICASEELLEGGKGVRFEADVDGETVPAFAVRFNGRPHAFVNRCAHVPIELDWMEGEFFDETGLYLVCSTHGAIYDPENGHCLGGPCAGQKLAPIAVDELAGKVFRIHAAD